MSRIIVDDSSSDAVVFAVTDMLNGGFIAKTARISYNVNKGLPSPEDTDKFPLILEGTLGSSSVSVHVYSVSAGYGGEGPHAMLDILNAAGFKFKDSDILTTARADSTGQIELTYTL